MSLASFPHDFSTPLSQGSAAHPAVHRQLHFRQRYPLNTFGNHLLFIKDQLLSPVGLGACVLSCGLGFLCLPLAAGFLVYLGDVTRRVCHPNLPSQEIQIPTPHLSRVCGWHRRIRTLTIATNFAAMTLSAGLGAWGSAAFNDSAFGLLVNTRLVVAPFKAMGILSGGE